MSVIFKKLLMPVVIKTLILIIIIALGTGTSWKFLSRFQNLLVERNNLMKQINEQNKKNKQYIILEEELKKIENKYNINFKNFYQNLKENKIKNFPTAEKKITEIIKINNLEGKIEEKDGLLNINLVSNIDNFINFAKEILNKHFNLNIINILLQKTDNNYHIKIEASLF